MKWIKEFQDGERIIGQLLVVSATKGVTEKGMNYINVTFQDKSGTLDAKKWEASDEDLQILVPGTVVNVDGRINVYKGANQMKINEVSKVTDLSEVDLSSFQRVSPIPLELMKKKLDAYLNSFTDKDVEVITRAVISHFYDKYLTYPAAVKIHHEFGSGIIHHSLAMADLAEDVAKRYPEVDRDILVAGALMHDIGKTIEYENPLMPAQTTEGKLCGHIAIMYAEFKKIVDNLNIKSEVPILLEHMILAHHGKLEWGSPVAPATREAWLLSQIDLIDSHLMVLSKTLEPIEEGGFTPRLWVMDDVSFYKPKNRKK